ncbi:MAG: WbqC family protein [Cyclobacteriaceae bacterium]
MSQTLFIEPHYLGSLEYFVLLKRFSRVKLEIHQHFSKQTFKNRCYILSSQGTQTLAIPVKFGNRTAYKDVKIDHNQSWVKDHWGAIYSSYGKSPFFEYFAQDFKDILDKKHKYLHDLSIDFLTLCLKLLQIDINISFSDSYEIVPADGEIDYRETVRPKLNFDKREVYVPLSYQQNFGNEFVPNLSILDLLFCEGTASSRVLNGSVFSWGEQL